MELAGKRILLTGATGGIGKVIATQLAAAGGQVLLVGRDQAALTAIADSLAGHGHSTLALDLLSPNAIEKLFEAAQAFGIDGLINMAGTNQLALLESMEIQDIERLLQLNLSIPIQVCKALLPLLADKTGSFIVNVGSILGSIGFAGSSVYCASKFGLRGFTESLLREVADKPIRIVYFAPRATDTALNSDAMQAMNAELKTAVDSPEAVAEQLLHGLMQTNKSRFFLGWPEKFFVRLNGLFPGLVDNALVKQLPVIRRYAGTAQAKPKSVGAGSRESQVEKTKTTNALS